MEEPHVIDWHSSESHVLLNPRMPAGDAERLRAVVARAPAMPAHVWLATSGTTGAIKMTALSKDALLTSAAAVNRHLEASRSDVWCSVLPTFHVGGLGIHARAMLSGARVVSMAWDASGFASRCAEERVTLSALVPTQVIDLVRARLRGPESLRAIVIGGGALPPALYREARALGWPVLPSYGLTECCSQVATALGDSPDLLLLDHVEVRIEAEGRLAIRSRSLLSGYATEQAGFVDPRVDGWFVTEDLGEVEGRRLRVSGRRGEFIKIGGESVDLVRLDAIAAEVAGHAAAVAALPDERLGWAVHLAVESGNAEAIAAEFNARVLPFERARAVHRVERIPRTELGKLMRTRLADLLAARGER